MHIHRYSLFSPDADGGGVPSMRSDGPASVDPQMDTLAYQRRNGTDSLTVPLASNDHGSCEYLFNLFLSQYQTNNVG